MLDKLIEEGRLLHQRIEKHFRTGPDALPPEERISVPELEAWYKGVGRALESQFGIESAEARLWREGLERIRKESWERVGRVSPYGGHWPIHNLLESLGLLAQIRLLQLNHQQSTNAAVSTTGTVNVVLLIHGIRTDAAWTSMVRSIMEADTNSRVVVLRYGYFDLLRFIFPFGLRSAPAKRLARLIQNVRADEPTARISVIAHSFGTYTITRILAEHRYIRISRLVMCGSVVPEDFRWEDIAAQLERPVLNECGTLDVWPVLASLITIGYGATGTFGFGDPVVRDRYHSLSHSGFFDEDFVRQNWVPFIRDGIISPSTLDGSRPSSPWWMPALSSAVARWAFLGILALAFLGGASAFSAGTSRDPIGQFAYHLGINREIPGGTAWVFLGYFGSVDTNPPHWIEGPHFRLIGTESLASNPPVLGARVELIRSRRLMIHQWKVTREKGKLDLICAGYDEESDDTRVRLPPDTILVVREAPDNCTYGNGATAIWVRVAYP